MEALKKIVESGVMQRQELLEILKEEFVDLIGGNAEMVVDKFLKNHAHEFVPEDAAVALRFNKIARAHLVQMAKPYIAARVRAFPFPREIEELLILRAGSEIKQES